MGKKISVFLFSIIIISVFTLSASAKIGFDLHGGLAMINPTEFNNGLLYSDASFNNHGFANAFTNIFIKFRKQ